MKVLRLTLAVLGLFVVVHTTVSTADGQAQTGARIVEINGDHKNGTATFRIDAPQARDVRIWLNTVAAQITMLSLCLANEIQFQFWPKIRGAARRTTRYASENSIRITEMLSWPPACRAIFTRSSTISFKEMSCVRIS